jgi:DNA mismatch endonuclease (patch repair protein)
MNMGRDKFTPEERSWIMSRVKSKNTTSEVKLRRELWKSGLRYRVATGSLPGKPDILFPQAKVVVFVDGEFWHGRKLSSAELNRMSEYWRNKIHRNVERDINNNELLKEMGFEVLRFFEQDVLKNTEIIANQIRTTVKSRARPNY